ncbi:MAG: GNAT family N-acetyltransferase [Bdellovibrionales bacterium]|nr:GNAT family N-acetyltransferase [Bdellovibrionales bacterium]
MADISFLIDTNVFIQLEDNKIISDSFNTFHKVCLQNPAITVYIHPLSKKELEKDKNIERKQTNLSKINKYSMIQEPPIADENQIKDLFGNITNENDKVDCQLLYVLKKHVISFLVTEDNRIHQRASRILIKKAQGISLKKQVLTVNQANNMLETLFPKEIDISLPNIQHNYLYNIEVEDTIFNSLKKDYPDFLDWWKRCSEEKVKSWNIQASGKIQAICIYKNTKEEYYKLSKKSLKLSTFKVDQFFRGKKLGELMLKQAFLYAVKNKYQSCWMTVFPKHKVLIDFIKDFGFKKIDETERKELVFQKLFFKPSNCQLSSLKFHIQYSPLYDDSKDVGKYIIPIQEKYYDVLFPEKKEQLSFTNYDEPKVPGNTIKKVYLCHAQTNQLKCGDLLFFYVSYPIQAITSIGIIESVFRSDKLPEVVSYIGKRSVYSFSKIKEMTKKKLLVIEFRLIKHLKNYIPFKKLTEKKIVNGVPQSIQKIKNYKEFKKYYL